jgi:hypothetical protein
MAWRGVPAFVTAAASPPASPAEARQQQLLSANTGQPGDPDLGARFQAINRQHFDGTLPAIPVRWEPGLAEVGALMGQGITLQGMFGRAGRHDVILLNPVVKDDPRALDRALCHEMVHAYLFSIGEEHAAHGPAFQAILQRLSIEHAFEGIAADGAAKAELRAWLDAESQRIDADHREIDDLDRTMRDDGEVLNRDIAAFNARADRPLEEAQALDARRDAFAERLDRARDEREHFNAEVARYNLMMAYPDGLDESAVVAPKGNERE